MIMRDIFESAPRRTRLVWTKTGSEIAKRVEREPNHIVRGRTKIETQSEKTA